MKSTLGSLTRARFTTLLDYGSGSGKTWQGLYYTDRNESDNSVIDMYSFNKRYFDTSNPTASVTDCDIEHMFANSWFGAKAGCKEAYCDLHHLVPSDYSANRSKSNHGPGMVVDTTFNNGLWVNGKTSANIPVFCPPDEYKGDFARAFFYIAATYGDTVTWQSEGTDNNFMTNSDWREFQTATSDLLLTWHRNDPVSEKELKRMNEVYKIQGNRNPFIDYPCLAEYIWGTYSGQTVSLSALTCAYDDNFSGDGCVTISTPTITSPTGTVNVGTTSQNTSITKTVTVKGINLSNGDLTLSLSGTNANCFSLSTISISKANATSGYNLTITYTPTANGNHTATLTISGCGVTSHTVQLTGTCAAVYTATWMVDGLQHAQTTAASGQTPAIPDAPHDCSATRVFMGWTAQSTVSSRPSDLFTDEVAALTSNKTYYAVFADAVAGTGSGGSDTYTFSSKAWKASPSDWTSGKDGNQYSSGKGVTVRADMSGANATSPISYSNVSSVVVNYCTNASSGAGSITIEIGESEITQAVTSTGGATLRDLSFNFSSTLPTGYPKITVTCTTNAIYINSITITYGPPVSYDNYSLTCGSTGVDVTATFLSQGISYATREGHSGETISAVTAPSSCAAYTFYNWSTHTYATHNTATPNIDYTGTYPTADITYNAVYNKTVTGTIAPVGTVMWAESFTSYSANNVPSGSENATTNGRQVYNGGAVTYTCVDGPSASTRVQTGNNAGGVTPELMLPYGNGSFTISNIPTGGADSLTLSFLANGVKSYLNVSSSTSGVNVGTLTKEGSNVTVDIKTSGVNTFALTITDIAGSNNVRVDNFYLAVKKAGSSSSASTTYYTTAPECNLPNTVTVTFRSNDGNNSTATQSIYENIATALRANSFVRPHYTFLGWSTSSSATTATYTDKHEVTLNANLVLYAIWENSPTYTVTYMNNGAQYAQVVDYPGETITGVGTPTLNNCEGHTFLGWSPNTYVLKNTETPELASLTTVPSKDTTLYAVYAYSETIGSGAPGASVGTTMWAEAFQGFENEDVPTTGNSGTTVYNNQTITYECVNGSSTTTTKVQTAAQYLAAGGVAPELMISKSGGQFNISGIPTGQADSLTLTFKTNSTKTFADFTLATDTAGITFGTKTKDGDHDMIMGISNNGATTFNLKIANNTSANIRVDNFSIVVSKQGAGGVTTNYFTTSPDCDCQVTITAIPNNTTYGTTSITNTTP